MIRFNYLQDRLFGICLSAYAFNRIVILPSRFHAHLPWAWPFLHSHCDDLLLLPVALPVVLWLHKIIGLRPHDLPPTWPEMLSHLAVWSVICKIVGPIYCHIGVADAQDVLFFAVGGCAACFWWNRRAPQIVPTYHEL